MTHSVGRTPVWARFAAGYCPARAFLALRWLWGRIEVALGWLQGRIGVAIGWLSTRFGVALTSHDVALNGASAFCILPSAFASGGFARLFKVRGSRFEVQSPVFTISFLNTTSLSRLPWGGLGAPWYHPGHTLVP